MEQSHLPPLQTEQEHEEEGHQIVHQHCRDLVSSLPVVEGCSFMDLRFHSGFFRPMSAMVGSMIVQKLFEARPTDIIMATLPKSGTTWLKALLFATVNRNSSPSSTGNLATLNPHQCVPFLEGELYNGDDARVPDMDSIPSPRLLATHTPFHFLPNFCCRLRMSSRLPMPQPQGQLRVLMALYRKTQKEEWSRASASRGRLRPVLPRAFPLRTFLGSHVRLLEGKPPSRGMQCPVHEVRGVDERSYGGAEEACGVRGVPLHAGGAGERGVRGHRRDMRVREAEQLGGEQGRETNNFACKGRQRQFFQARCGWRLDEPSNTRHGPTYRQDY
ncbi:cytosolic sulfotransferase 12-like [Iris pallida]|uniref:Sulfotransferase n=1 Tax=Iris pallida TaxID=29817 RepID=A0AAX6GIV9_IRIPA|nr:cytosolic sulfotransferase 12-like [Iris pallida]